MRDINVLIVESDNTIARDLADYIEELGYTVVGICTKAKDILPLISEKNVNIVFMDIYIEEDKQGIQEAIAIKEKYPHTEIIFLCDRFYDSDIQEAMDIDPIAYLSKPINRAEQHVSLKIALNRITKLDTPKQLNVNHIILDDEFYYDTSSSVLFYCDEPIHLTKKERNLLELLVTHKDTIVGTSTISNVVWPDKYTNDNTIRSLVKRLRQKLNYKFIKTYSTQGYMISESKPEDT